jgi:hypothetical protein
VLAIYTLDQLCRRLRHALRMICGLAGVDIDGSVGRLRARSNPNKDCEDTPASIRVYCLIFASRRSSRELPRVRWCLGARMS